MQSIWHYLLKLKATTIIEIVQPDNNEKEYSRDMWRHLAWPASYFCRSMRPVEIRDHAMNN